MSGAKPNVCFSGGAEGSDLAWGRVAKSIGHGVIHFGFAGHKSKAPVEEIVILPDDDLSSADPYCELASARIKRHWPPKSPFVKNLLRRNWFQVEISASCYAISDFKLNNARFELGQQLVDGMVGGGTAWATAMFIDRHGGNACPCYVFDQDTCYWFEWKGVWTRIYEPPKPKDVYAGIGTRKLNMVGNLAIEVLMDYKQDFHSKTYPMLRPINEEET
jgi:hypothetical protein